MEKINLSQIRKKKRVSLAELAKQVGVSRQLIWGFENGKNKISNLVLEKIANLLNVSLGQILGEEKIDEIDDSINFYQDSVKQSVNEKLLKALSGESLSPFNNLVLVKKYDVFASAGDGMEVLSEEVEGEIAFEKNFLKKISGTNPDQLVFIGVRGDSMYPTFKDNDVILIDKNRREIAAGGVFVIRMGNVLKVKRIFFNSFQKKLKIVSDNKVEINGERLYPDYEISTDDVANLDVVGKVIWAAWSLK